MYGQRAHVGRHRRRDERQQLDEHQRFDQQRRDQQRLDEHQRLDQQRLDQQRLDEHQRLDQQQLDQQRRDRHGGRDEHQRLDRRGGRGEQQQLDRRGGRGEQQQLDRHGGRGEQQQLDRRGRRDEQQQLDQQRLGRQRRRRHVGHRGHERLLVRHGIELLLVRRGIELVELLLVRHGIELVELLLVRHGIELVELLLVELVELVELFELQLFLVQQRLAGRGVRPRRRTASPRAARIVVNPAMNGLAEECQPAPGFGFMGFPCTENSDCVDDLCLDGYCSGPCTSVADCSTGGSCSPETVSTGGLSGVFDVCVACAVPGLAVEPNVPQTITVTAGQMTPTVTFDALIDCGPAAVAWCVDLGNIATIAAGPSSTGVLVPTGTAGGLVTVTADLNGTTVQEQVFIKLVAARTGPPGTRRARSRPRTASSPRAVAWVAWAARASAAR